MWIRLDVVRMFIEHTCPPGQSIQPADRGNGFELWKVTHVSITIFNNTVVKV